MKETSKIKKYYLEKSKDKTFNKDSKKRFMKNKASKSVLTDLKTKMEFQYGTSISSIMTKTTPRASLRGNNTTREALRRKLDPDISSIQKSDSILKMMNEIDKEDQKTIPHNNISNKNQNKETESFKRKQNKKFFQFKDSPIFKGEEVKACIEKKAKTEKSPLAFTKKTNSSLLFWEKRRNSKPTKRLKSHRVQNKNLQDLDIKTSPSRYVELKIGSPNFRNYVKITDESKSTRNRFEAKRKKSGASKNQDCLKNQFKELIGQRVSLRDVEEENEQKYAFLDDRRRYSSPSNYNLNKLNKKGEEIKKSRKNNTSLSPKIGYTAKEFQIPLMPSSIKEKNESDYYRSKNVLKLSLIEENALETPKEPKKADTIEFSPNESHSINPKIQRKLVEIFLEADETKTGTITLRELRSKFKNDLGMLLVIDEVKKYQKDDRARLDIFTWINLLNKFCWDKREILHTTHSKIID